METIYSRLKDPNTGKIGPKDIFCSKDEKDLYVRLDEPFRGEKIFATFTNAQYDSLIILLRYLTAEYNIPREFLPEKVRYTATDQVIDFKGILSHVNYRMTGKWDLGPAFDWNRVIEGVQTESFTPKARILMSIEAAEKELRKAKREVTQAQNKVTELEAKIEKLKRTPIGSKGRSVSTKDVFISEKAIDKKMPKKRSVKESAKKNMEEGLRDNEDELRNYYL